MLRRTGFLLGALGILVVLSGHQVIGVGVVTASYLLLGLDGTRHGKASKDSHPSEGAVQEGREQEVPTRQDQATKAEEPNVPSAPATEQELQDSPAPRLPAQQVKLPPSAPEFEHPVSANNIVVHADPSPLPKQQKEEEQGSNDELLLPLTKQSPAAAQPPASSVEESRVKALYHHLRGKVPLRVLRERLMKYGTCDLSSALGDLGDDVCNQAEIDIREGRTTHQTELVVAILVDYYHLGRFIPDLKTPTLATDPSVPIKSPVDNSADLTTIVLSVQDPTSSVSERIPPVPQRDPLTGGNPTEAANQSTAEQQAGLCEAQRQQKQASEGTDPRPVGSTPGLQDALDPLNKGQGTSKDRPDLYPKADPKAPPAWTVDPKRAKELRKADDEIQEMLGKYFQDEQENTSSETMTTATMPAPGESQFQQKDPFAPHFLAFFAALKQDQTDDGTVNRQWLITFARKRGLMAEAFLDAVNTWSDKTCDVLLLEEDGDAIYYVDQMALQAAIQQFKAAAES